MKLIMMALVVVPLASLLSSCYSYKSMTRKETITKEFLSKLEPGKKYNFELMIGETQTIYITTVTGETITGYLYQDSRRIINRESFSESTITGRIEYQTVYTKMTKSNYSDSFENIIRNVAKISVQKIDPIKITALIVVPAAVIFGAWAIANLSFQ